MLLEISVPVYRKDKWARLERDGKIQVSSEVDTLSEGYPSLKQELDALLTKVDAETRLADQADQLETEIQHKSRILKDLVRDIDKATQHYNDLKIFLERLGIDPIAPRLTFDKRFLLRDASLSQVEAVRSSEF